MSLKTLCLMVVAVLIAPLAARADSAPTSEDVKKVVEYYKNGKDGGPILAEIKPCLKVDTTKGSATIWECIEPVTAKVKKDTTVHAWMNWLVPKDGKYDDLTVQWLFNGEVRSADDMALNSSSYAGPYFKSKTVNKVGKWEVKVLRGGKELGSAKFEVE